MLIDFFFFFSWDVGVIVEFDWQCHELLVSLSLSLSLSVFIKDMIEANNFETIKMSAYQFINVNCAMQNYSDYSIFNYALSILHLN